MRFLLSALFAVALGLCACDSPDISDNDPISTTMVDASTGGGEDGGTPDANTTDGGVLPDAMLSEGQLFCNRYDMVCGYAGGAQYFTDENDCLATYATFTADRITCVNDALDNTQCTDAAGKPPCN
jgi:hypothetical protein